MPQSLTWNGHSNFRVDVDGKVLVIDPFFEGNPTAPAGADSLERVDAILLTHDHGDHIGQAVDIARRTGARVVCQFDLVEAYFAPEGLAAQCLGMNIGGSVEVAGVRAKMVQAMHSCRIGSPCGYIITLPDGFTLYHAGDTGVFASMELFGRFHRIDLALLPIGGHFTMDPEQAAYACKLLKARGVVPMHWGTFPVLEQGTEAFDREIARFSPETRLYALKPGDSLPLALVPDNEVCSCD